MKRCFGVGLALALLLALALPAVANAADPVLLIKGYRTDPEQLTPGAKFKLEITLQNVTIDTARNVVVTLGGSSSSGNSSNAGTGNDIATLGTGSAKFVGDITGQATSIVTFDLIASPNAQPGVYNMPITIDAESMPGPLGEAGKKLQFTQGVGLVLTREATFDIDSFDYPAKVYVQRQFDLRAKVTNASDFGVDAVNLKMESAGLELLDAEKYVGKLQAGGSAQITVKAIGSTAGVQTVSLVISYKDDFNQVKEIRKDYQVQVDEKPVIPTQTPEAEQSQKRERTTFLSRMGAFFMAFLGMDA